MCDTYRKWYVQSCPLHDDCSATSWTKVKRCTSWISEEDCRKVLARHLQTSWNHEEWRKANSNEDLLAIVEMAEVEVEDVSKTWFDARAEPAKKKQRPSRAAASEDVVPSSSTSTRRLDDRDDDDARVARIAAIAVTASRGTMPVSVPSLETPTPSSFADHDGSELVMVTKDELIRISENLGKATVAVGHAVRMFSSAAAAFQQQQTTIASMKADVDNILNRV